MGYGEWMVTLAGLLALGVSLVKEWRSGLAGVEERLVARLRETIEAQNCLIAELKGRIVRLEGLLTRNGLGVGA